MDAKNPQDSESAVKAAAPVVGQRGSKSATSANVHLYLDPKTADDTKPLLFADWEGMEGSTSTVSEQSRRKSAHTLIKKIPAALPEVKGSAESSRPGSLMAKVKSSRNLVWAKGVKRKRQYAVAEMFPRIFYAFSDVIVFVNNEPKYVSISEVTLNDFLAVCLERKSRHLKI